VKVSEESGRVVGRAIAILVTEFELTETVSVALKGAIELAQGIALKDLNAEKGISALILELCEQVPEPVIVISTNTLTDFLAIDVSGTSNVFVLGPGYGYILITQVLHISVWGHSVISFNGCLDSTQVVGKEGRRWPRGKDDAGLHY
jgi:hypothetical protein